MKIILLLLLLGSAVSAQTYRPLGQVQDFLGLSNTQVDAILKNNDDYNRTSQDKQNRIVQVQSEIAEYTAASTIDPMELGIRYTEIEYLCRQMKDAAVDTQTKNVALLNADQKAKLKVLDDALKLAPIISQAQSAGVLGTIASAPSSFTSGGTGSWFNTASFAGGVSGCYVPGTSVLTSPFYGANKAAAASK